MSRLDITNLHVVVEDKEILHGVDLTMSSGEIHAIMGPNGSGKSTLANALAGHPSYTVSQGKISLDDKNLGVQTPDERAKSGLFLAFQYPSEVAGVRVYNFLKVAYDQHFQDKPEKKFPSVLAFRKYVDEVAEELGVRKELLSRGLNEGFSGGEKKRLEILQMAILQPKFAILDETDSGLDIDAIQAVAQGVQTVVSKYKTGIIVITHYQRILNFLKPDSVHIMKEGKIVQSGDGDLVASLEKSGYKNI